MEHLLLILREHQLNWFALVAELRTLLQNYSEDTLAYALTEFPDDLIKQNGFDRRGAKEGRAV